jgi:hypothetical protein|tara:strand:+ start:5157 stop:5588 length:432 start_codon:yes stop_codon:yes gene_type:complete
MFVSFTSIKNYSSAVGASILRPNRSNSNGQNAYTIFSDSSRDPVIKITFKYPGSRGNNFVACLVKLSATKYRFRLYDSGETRLNTITEEDATPPANVIENLVASINSNATFKKYIHVTFYKETTEAMSDSTAVGDGQKLRGGR